MTSTRASARASPTRRPAVAAWAFFAAAHLVQHVEEGLAAEREEFVHDLAWQLSRATMHAGAADAPRTTRERGRTRNRVEILQKFKESVEESPRIPPRNPSARSPSRRTPGIPARDVARESPLGPLLGHCW